MRDKILLVGECVLDIIQEVETFPNEDDDIRSTNSIWQRGGNASNNATILTMLGNKCELLSTFSDSKMFNFVLDDLKDRDIDIKHCYFYPNCDIPLSSVLLSKSTGLRTIIHSNKNLPHVNFENFDKCDLNEYKWIHFEARNPDQTTKMMLKIKTFNEDKSEQERIKISLDLEKKREENVLLIKYADVVFLGRDYAEFLGCKDMKSAVIKLKELSTLQEYFNDNLVIICPWGTDGACALSADGKYVECPCYPPTQIVDSLGAGDTFCGATLSSLMDNFNDIETAIDQGCRVAGFKVGFFGYDGIKDYQGTSE
ncbi:unnamed protein product [Diamesa serratosioi]